MPTPGEHKTVQSRILQYAQDIGWSYVSRDEAQRRRGFDSEGSTPQERARKAALFFGDALYNKVRALNPKYKEAAGALIGDLTRLRADIYGNRDFLTYLRNQGKFFCDEEGRELDLQLIDYADCGRPRPEWQNVYEVTEEFYANNGRFGTREDVVFLINGIPVLVVECKNATKNEAIALGVDQIRRYHTETPEVMVPEMLFTATKVINLVKSIEKTAEENSEDPYLIAMAERARSVQESFEDRQTSTADALTELLAEIERNRHRKEEQTRLGMDGITYFVLCKLNELGMANAVPVSKKVGQKFLLFPNWRNSEKELRDLRQQITFAIFAEEDDLDKVTATVDSIFAILQKSVG